MRLEYLSKLSVCDKTYQTGTKLDKQFHLNGDIIVTEKEQETDKPEECLDNDSLYE